MGDEAAASLRIDGVSHAGKADLETTDLIFRGDARLVFPLKEIESAAAEDGRLCFVHAGRHAELDIGSAAGRWAEKIRNPRGLLDKLGVKPAHTVALVRLVDPEFEAQLAARGAAVSRDETTEGRDLVFLDAATVDELADLPALARQIKPDGAIWVVSPKGKGAILKDVEVMAAARAAGLVDTKVVSFSATRTALKLVIPRDRR